MDDTNPIAVARFKLAHLRPYFNTVIWSLTPIETEGLGTLAVDKYLRLYYDPAVFEMWDIDELTAVLLHEINHVIREHSTRVFARDPRKWNIAADMEINDDLVDEYNIKLPNGCLQPSTFGFDPNLTAEEYYELVEDMVTEGCGGAAGGECGGIAGNGGEYEVGAPGSGGAEGIPGVTEAEREAVLNKTAKDIQEEMGRNPGTIPGHLQRWAEKTLVKKVHWKKEISAAVRQAVTKAAGLADYTYTKLSRRSTKKILLPRMFQPVPNISVVIDTSGSISKVELNEAMTHIKHVIEAIGYAQGINAISCDSQVHNVQKVLNVDKITPTGGGGTDMGKGLEAAAKLNSEVTIVLTDGYTPWPDDKPRGCGKVIILLNNNSKWSLDGCPAWARVIVQEKDEQ